MLMQCPFLWLDGPLDGSVLYVVLAHGYQVCCSGAVKGLPRAREDSTCSCCMASAVATEATSLRYNKSCAPTRVHAHGVLHYSSWVWHASCCRPAGQQNVAPLGVACSHGLMGRQQGRINLHILQAWHALPSRRPDHCQHSPTASISSVCRLSSSLCRAPRAARAASWAA